MTQNTNVKVKEAIIYKKYEPNMGFEDIQATIYNAAVKKYGGSTVTAEQIKFRIENSKPKQDFMGITYAFDKENNPLAYIQYRENNQGRVRIGFPQSVDGTPRSVQDKLFNDLYSYLSEKYSDRNEIFLGYINKKFSDIIDQIKEYGFESLVVSWDSQVIDFKKPFNH